MLQTVIPDAHCTSLQLLLLHVRFKIARLIQMEGFFSGIQCLQDFIFKVEDTMLGNEGCMDAVNVSVAFQKLAAACCAVPPVGEIQTSARRVFHKLVSMALNLQGTFKLDPLNMTLGALARLSAQPSSNLMPPAGTDEAFNIQVTIGNSLVPKTKLSSL